MTAAKWLIDLEMLVELESNAVLST